MIWALCTTWAVEPPEPEDSSDADLEVIVHAPEWRTEKRAEVKANGAPETGTYTLSQRDIDATPGSLGDAARAIHTLPGVVSDGDVAAGFHVRGGEQSEVTFLLDRVPLDNPFHLAGFNSVFNPDLVQALRFHASAAPASLPSGTSAVVEVTTWDGTAPEGLDGTVDLSVTGARLMVKGPVDNAKKFTIALAARRSWVEGYVAVLKALDVVDSATIAPEFLELSARVAWRPHTRHRILFTAMRASDSLRLVDSEDEAALEFDGSLDLRSALTLGSLDHRYVKGRVRLQTTAALTEDRSLSNRVLERDTLLQDTVLTRAYARSDVQIPFSDNATVLAGMDISRFAARAEGILQDTRSFPTWVQPGLGAYGFQTLTVDSRPTPWLETSGYLQAELGAAFGKGKPIAEGVPIVPGVKVRAGTRYHATGLSGEFLLSPRASVSIPLPTGTIPKASVGLYTNPSRNPFLRDPAFGGQNTGAQRARHLVFGIDQVFPLPGKQGGLLRLEAYDIALSDLIVNADTVRTPAFENVGSGHNRGLDVMVSARAGPWNAQLTYGLLYTRRVNPLNTVWPTTVAPPQDQRHTGSLAVDFEAGSWTFLARYSGHSGRPTSEVEVLEPEFESVRLTCLNCSRLNPTHTIDLRTEWRQPSPRRQLSAYLEILNIGNIRSPYLASHAVVEGQVESTTVNHLPMRPLFGVRADF